MVAREVAGRVPSGAVLEADGFRERVESRVQSSFVRLRLGFVFLFMAFSATKALQTGLHAAQGFVCLASLYGTFALACVLGAAIVSSLGERWSLVLGSMPYVAFVFANVGGSMAMACVAVGVGAAVLWSAQGTAMGRFAEVLALVSHEPIKQITNHLGSRFFAFFRLTGAAGCLVASIILLTATSTPHSSTSPPTTPQNGSSSSSSSTTSSSSSSSPSAPPQAAITALFVTLGILGLVGIANLAFVTPPLTILREEAIAERKKEREEGGGAVGARGGGKDSEPPPISQPQLPNPTAPTSTPPAPSAVVVTLSGSGVGGGEEKGVGGKGDEESLVEEGEGSGILSGGSGDEVMLDDLSKAEILCGIRAFPSPSLSPPSSPSSASSLPPPRSRPPPFAGGEMTWSDLGVVVYRMLELLLFAPDVRLLSPAALFHGLSMGWFFGDVLGVLVVEYMGVSWDPVAGFVFFLLTAVASKYLAGLTSRFGRRPLLAASFGIFLLTYLLAALLPPLLLHSPTPHVPILLLTALFALGDAVAETLLPAMFQSTASCTKDASSMVAGQSLYKCLQSLGFFIQFMVGAATQDAGVQAIPAKAVELAAAAALAAAALAALDRYVEPID